MWLRNLFTSNSSRQYISIIKFWGTERTWHQTPSVWTPTINATNFACFRDAPGQVSRHPVWEPLAYKILRPHIFFPLHYKSWQLDMTNTSNLVFPVTCKYTLTHTISLYLFSSFVSRFGMFLGCHCYYYFQPQLKFGYYQPQLTFINFSNIFNNFHVFRKHF